MHLDQYTADAICRAMGLPSFVESAWTQPTFRLLLKPSFDPEVCLTLLGPPKSPRISVVALTQMLWQQPGPCRLPELRDDAAVPVGAYEQICSEFASAYGDRDPGGRRVCVDGIGAECCYVANDALQQFAEHVYRPSVTAFVSHLVHLAWHSCQHPGIRNALAACARYVGDEYPLQPEPEEPPASRLLVLGTPEERAEYLEVLRRHCDSAKQSRSSEPVKDKGQQQKLSASLDKINRRFGDDLRRLAE